MKASELIEKLNVIIREYGDLPVEIPSWGDLDYDDAEDTRVYTYNLGTDMSYTAIIIN